MQQNPIKLYRAQLDDHWLFEDQIRLGSDSKLTSVQRQEVERLATDLVKLKEKSEAILNLMDTMRDSTIEKILLKDDLEIVIDVLSGKLKL